MTIYISILRGINVAGKNILPMANLKAVYETAGFTRVRTYLQSGNVVFEAPEQDGPELATRLERIIEADCGLTVPVLVRTAAEMERVALGNPFLGREGVTPTKLHVTFLAGEPPAGALEPAKGAAAAGEEIHQAGMEIYLHCPHGYGATRLSNQFFEKTLSLTATTRNWNSVTHLHQLSKG